jgi:hypothetical protein
MYVPHPPLPSQPRRRGLLTYMYYRWLQRHVLAIPKPRPLLRYANEDLPYDRQRRHDRRRGCYRESPTLFSIPSRDISMLGHH